MGGSQYPAPHLYRPHGGDPVSAAALNWDEANRAFLMAQVAYTCARVRCSQGTPGPERERLLLEVEVDQARRDEAAAALPSPPALEILARLLHLDAFSVEVLELALAPELGITPPVGTTGSALESVENSHWSAFLPTSPLRRWRLLEWNTSLGVANQPLKVDERILHFALGLPTLDHRLRPWLISPPEVCPLTPRQVQISHTLASVWRQRLEGGREVLPLLVGDDTTSLRSVAQRAAAAMSLHPRLVRAADLPPEPDARYELGILLEREALLSGLVLLLEVDDLAPPDVSRSALGLVERLTSLVVLLGRDLPNVSQVAVVRLELPPPNTRERRVMWEDALGADLQRLPQGLDPLLNHFPLSARDISAACASARLLSEDRPFPQVLWEVCRVLGRPRLAQLAHHIQSEARLEDVVLPPLQKATLTDMLHHVRRRLQVLEGWGYAQRVQRGQGVSALFTGPSGTGKTFAAEALANTLELDLYRVDLSQVVNKYIGETEKNLRRIFESAEGTGAILLFDEADALFGKRTEVKDSHDRYANIEVDYLLQRMEAYRGLALLTTNLKGAIDGAFLRRLSFVVPFPFPEPALRAELWRRAFPRQTPTEGLDFDRLARLGVAGGNIRNIALHAAYVAAGEDSPVRMAHLAAAARSELLKLERAFSEAELAGWV